MKLSKFITLLIFTLSILISIIASQYGTFCDEADVISASWLMSKGYHLYSDIFCHHMPIPYYFLSIFQTMNISNITTLRIIFAIVTQSYFILLYIFFKKRMNPYTIPIVALLYALMRNISMQNYILAETFLALGFFTIFLELITKPKMDYTIKDKILISFATFITLGSSLIAVYPLAIFYLYYIIKRLILYFKEKENIKRNFTNDLIFMLIVLLPFVIVAIYMLCTNTLKDFIENGIEFNTKYYSLYNKEATPISLIIAQFTNFPARALEKLKFATIYFPLFEERAAEIFEGLNFIVFLIGAVALICKKRKNSIIIILFTYFCYMRDSFHASTLFILCNYFITQIVLWIIKEICQKKPKVGLLKSIAILILVSYTIIYTSILCIDNGRMLQSKQYVSNYGLVLKDIILATTDEKDKIWAAPLYAEIYFTTKRQPANKNIFYLPWQSIKPGVNDNIVKDLEQNKAKVIIYNGYGDIWKVETKFYAKQLEEYLEEKYFRINSMPIIYYRKEDKEEIEQRLLKNKLARREENGEVVFCYPSI